jgi:hypothetical protein
MKYGKYYLRITLECAINSASAEREGIMYKKYVTATLVTFPLTLPTSLFDVSALVKGVSTDPNTGMSLTEKFKRMTLSEDQKALLYRDEVTNEPVIGEPKPLLQAQRTEFNVIDDVLHIKPADLMYGDIASKPWIQPSDIIIDVYEFTNLDEFAALIPSAIAQWSEDDPRVTEMVKTLALATQCHQRVQNFSIVTCSHVSDLYSYRAKALDFHLAVALVDPHASLKLKREPYCILNQKQVEILISQLFIPNVAELLLSDLKAATIEIPIFHEAKDWMGDLRSRDNHFRSVDDVFTRVIMPLSKHFADIDADGYYDVKQANELTDVESTPVNVFAVGYLSARPIPCETCLIVNKSLVPVFFSVDPDDVVLNPFEKLSYILYRGEGSSFFSTNFSAHRLKEQPLEYRDRSKGSYIVVGLKGITVYTLAGLQKYYISYAKINEEALSVLASHLSA